MQDEEAAPTTWLLKSLRWRAVDAEAAEKAGELGRSWLPSHRGIDSADLAIAATAIVLDAMLLTLNVRRFPMFGDLARPY
jgi:predicted nucleic acid-binding protein